MGGRPRRRTTSSSGTPASLVANSRWRSPWRLCTVTVPLRYCLCGIVSVQLSPHSVLRLHVARGSVECGGVPGRAWIARRPRCAFDYPRDCETPFMRPPRESPSPRRAAGEARRWGQRGPARRAERQGRPQLPLRAVQLVERGDAPTGLASRVLALIAYNHVVALVIARAVVWWNKAGYTIR